MQLCAVPREAADEHGDRRKREDENHQRNQLSLLHSNPFPGVPQWECGPLLPPYARRAEANPSDGGSSAASGDNRPMSSSQSVELVLRGYRAFVAGDFGTVAGLLAPDVEWYGADGEGAAGVEKDALDDRPLQTRRYYTIGRYWAIATVRDERIARVQDYPSLSAALDATGAAEDEI